MLWVSRAKREIKTRAQVSVDLWDNPFEKTQRPHWQKVLEGLEQGEGVCHQWRVNGELEVLGSLAVACGLLEGMSSDGANVLLSSDEEG